MESLKTALLQYDILWEDPSANYALVEKLIASADADIFFLPEMFSTGFTMQPEKLAEPFCGPSFKFLQKKAIEKNAVFTASIPTKAENGFVNRLYWIQPNETFTFYDKRHLFTLAGEEKHYTAGTDRKIVEYKGWKFLPQICYDLRFPVWSRNDLDYDILFYVANWPDQRIAAWDALLKARAIENMAYVVGVNRIGPDGNEIPHSGHSSVFDAMGEELQPENNKDSLLLYTLFKKDLKKAREKFKFLEDRDSFEIRQK